MTRTLTSCFRRRLPVVVVANGAGGAISPRARAARKTAPDHLAFSVCLNLSDLGAGGVGEGVHGAGGADGAACGARGQSAAHRLLWQWRGPAGRGRPGALSSLVSPLLVVFTSRTNISQPAFLAYIGRQKSPMAGSRLRQFLSLTHRREIGSRIGHEGRHRPPN